PEGPPARATVFFATGLFHPDGLHPGAGLAEIVGDDDSVPAGDVDVLAVAARGDGHAARFFGDVELVPEALLRLLRPERPGEQDQDHHEETEARSEEHTSELQSRVDLVCRLLLA